MGGWSWEEPEACPREAGAGQVSIYIPSPDLVERVGRGPTNTVEKELGQRTGFQVRTRGLRAENQKEGPWKAPGVGLVTWRWRRDIEGNPFHLPAVRGWRGY